MRAEKCIENGCGVTINISPDLVATSMDIISLVAFAKDVDTSQKIDRCLLGEDMKNVLDKIYLHAFFSIPMFGEIFPFLLDSIWTAVVGL